MPAKHRDGRALGQGACEGRGDLFTISFVAPAGSGSRRFGNYEILSVLGKGGMGEVYRAKVVAGPRKGWIVALKRLPPALAENPEYLDRFTTEADLSKLLDHPHIVKVLEAGVTEDTYFIAMEFVDGTDLARILRRCRRGGIQLPVDFAIYLAKVLLEALAYAHAAVGASGAPLHIVHCDVSPSNLFISRTGEVKLGDFGVARVRNVGAEDSVVEGKVHYLSPEAIAGRPTTATDLWAAAVTLYELLTLQRPFVGTTPEQVLEAIRHRRYRPIRELRPELAPAIAQVIDRAFAEEPSARFQTAGEFAKTLGGLFDERIGNPMAIAAMVRGLFGAGRAKQ